ncbi:MAG: hypothetical protein NTV31_05040 [Bacteroidia bacterium]|nr:hypothetical protein [Bacteroidia bacterium]
MINEAFQTIIVMSTAVTSVFAIGFCVASLTARCFHISWTSEQFWAAAPLVGVCAIILICQNLLYLNIRIPYAAILIWMGVGLAAIISVFRSQFSLSGIPWKLIATGLAIYAIHGSGLLVSGASNYYGYGWGDMYNYVSQAQFFIDFPFNSTVVTHEYLRTAHYYMHDRIGQTVLHAFMTSSSGADAQQTFGATILLSPMLIFFSIFLLSTSLGIERRFAYPAAIIASLSPAIASIHLECFFSQAMAMPFIFLWPLAISRLKSHLGVYSVLVAGLLFAVTSAIYTEVIPPLILISVIALFVSYWRNDNNSTPISQIVRLKRLWRQLPISLYCLCLALAVGLCANIGFFKSTFVIMGRTVGSNVFDHLYPWAFKAEGLARLWIGHQYPSLSEWLLYSLVFFSAIVVLAAIAYALSLCRKGTAPSQLFSALIVCIPLAPLLLSVLTRDKYPYQFFKLLLIVWPLILFFAACGIAEWISRIRQGRGFIYFLIALICANVGITNRIAFASAKPETVAKSSRGGAHLLIDENFKQMRMLLDRIEGKRVYIWWYDKVLCTGKWRGRWLAYYARKNVVWSMNPTPASGHGYELSPFESLSFDSIKVPAIGISWRDISVRTKEKIGSSRVGTDPFWLYQLTDDGEVLRLDQASRECVVVSRSMRLSVDKDTDSGTWYPLWVAGREGSATLITVNFTKEGVRFRFDQEGYPATILEPGCKCSGAELQVSVLIDQFKRKVTINCNGSVAEGNIPDVLTSLSWDDPLGVNDVSALLEGKYPLAKVFPGKLVEQPR